MSITKAYRIDTSHSFYVETTDIEEVILNYEIPDFIDCKSIVSEPEYIGGGNTWTEMAVVENG